jgi:two-component system sensor histidine kinase/response regulator
MSTSILVVEDEALLRQGLKALLQSRGYEVATAANGQEALDVLAQSRPDLILADIMMPVMDGYALYEAVRANPTWDAIPFVFLTALGDKTDIRLGRELGVDDYVVKPCEPEEVLASIQGRLRRVEAYQAEAESRLEGLKKQIIIMLGHELNTPLTYVMNFAELAMEDLETLDAGGMESLLAGVLRGAERLQQRVKDCLTLLQLDSGLLASEFEQSASPNLHLPAVILGTVEAFTKQADEKGIRLEAHVPPVLPPVMTQTSCFTRILSRLLDNALKFTRAGDGHVVVSAGAEDERMWVRVADNGVGIAPKAIPRLCRPFEQIDRQTQEQQGAGLGLAIVKGLVDLHAGEIQIESQPGRGSTFTVWLPLAG